MKSFLKIFLISLVCFTLLLGGGVYAFIKYSLNEDETANIGTETGSDGIIDSIEENPVIPMEPEDELLALVEESKRINVLLLGMEDTRTDTIILASFDPETKNVDLISIPRDTYFHSEGYDRADQKKINAVYGRSGVKGTMSVVSYILGGVPVHEYVKVSYEGVEDIVDSLGGVTVDIPFNMKYDDPYDDPPLHIDLKKGTQVLNGKEAIQFLRFRKNNDGTGYADGDLGRIRAQQQFLKAAADKALSFRLPVVAHTAFKFVKTSMDIEDILYYAKSAMGITTDSIRTYRIPGKSSNQTLSYFIHDEEGTRDMMLEIYKRGIE